jgi:hypothetical protein
VTQERVSTGSPNFRQLRTGYEDEVSALESADSQGPVTAVDSAQWAQVWKKTGSRFPLPPVNFEREFAVLWGFSRGSCGGHKSGVDSVRFDGNAARVYAWSDGGGACLDTTSYSVLSIAIRRPGSLRGMPTVTITESDRVRWVEPKLSTYPELLAMVHRLPPDSFPAVPKVVRATLKSRHCEIPQWVGRPPNNVVTGAFTANGTVEWAALCSVRDTSQILIITAATGIVVDSVERISDAEVMEWMEIGLLIASEGEPGKLGKPTFSRALGVVPMAVLREWGGDGYGVVLPLPIDHDAIRQAVGFSKLLGDRDFAALYHAQGRWFRRGAPHQRESLPTAVEHDHGSD